MSAAPVALRRHPPADPTAALDGLAAYDMTSRQRTIVRRVVLEGTRPAQVALELGISRRTVYYDLRAGRARLASTTPALPRTTRTVSGSLLQVHLERAETLERIGYVAEAARLLDDVAQTAPTPADRAVSLARRSMLERNVDESRSARTFCEARNAFAEASDDAGPELVAELALAEMGQALTFGELERSVAAESQLVRVLGPQAERGSGDARVALARASVLAFQLRQRCGDLAAAVETIERAARWLEGADGMRAAAFRPAVLNGLAVAHLSSGGLRHVRGEWSEAYRLATECGNLDIAGAVLYNVLGAWYHTGEAPLLDGPSALATALDALRAPRARAALDVAERVVAEALLGELDVALSDIARERMALRGAYGSWPREAFAATLHAQLLVRAGRPAEALRVAREARNAWQRAGCAAAPGVSLVEGLALERLGRRGEALDAARDAASRSGNAIARIPAERLVYRLTGDERRRHTAEALAHVLHGNDDNSSRPPARLTGREREIALLALAGHRTSDIAQRLGISTKTASNHLCSAYARLGIRARWQLRRELIDGAS